MENDPLRNDAIFEWKMTNAEAEAYKLACMYEKEFLRIFRKVEGFGKNGEYRRNTLPKTSDPRKSFLFRHCWKLRRETRGLLEPHQHKQYITANLLVLKMNYEKHGTNVEPPGICGDKAWGRWKMVERWIADKEKDVSSTPPIPSVSRTNPKVIREIDRTKKFLYERCDGEPTFEKIAHFLDSGIFKLWIMTEKISKFYFVMSPFVKRACNVEEFSDSCSFDPILFREKITDEVKEYFRHEYKHEYQSETN